MAVPTSVLVADPMDALREFLLEQGNIVQLVEDRVYTQEMPRRETDVQPRNAIVISPASGTSPLARSWVRLRTSRIDVRCYGSTPYNTRILFLNLAYVLVGLSRVVRRNTLIHHMSVSAWGILHRDEQLDWPYMFSSWQVTFSEVVTP